jgi:alpha-L-rhamnosidase
MTRVEMRRRSRKRQAVSKASLRAGQLRVEYRTDPLGLDVDRPRVSWVLESTDDARRGQRQTAYQVIVASSEKLAGAGRGDLWDTGKVLSDRTHQIEYRGKKLVSGERCYWRVKVWNEEAKPSGWSDVATWSMGLLKKGDWKAKWIGFDQPAESFDQDDHTRQWNLDGCKWIWADEGDPTKEAEKGTRLFRGWFDLPDKAVKNGLFLVTADNGYVIAVNGERFMHGGEKERTYAIDVARKLKPGKNLAAFAATNHGGAAGLVGRLWVEFEDGEVVTRDIDGSYKVAKEAEGWESTDLDDGGWAPAKELVTVGQAPFATPRSHALDLPPVPMLRKEFEAKKRVRRATAYATALGLYELRINGERVGEDQLAPGWTEYKKRVYYQAYDVTGRVKKGANAVGVLLGDGWYAGYFGWTGKKRLYGGDPRAMVQIVIEYADGSTESVATDASWKAAYGPWRQADLLQGSAYDARLEMPGWDDAGFDDSAWQKVAVGAQGDAAKAQVQAHPGVPVRKHEEIKPKRVTSPKPGVYVFDLGQNMVGWVRLKIRGEKGQRITIRHAEMLNPDGTLYRTALRTARAEDVYVCKGKGVEIWEPQFTFHGFRYVEVTGLTSAPKLDLITGVVVHSAVERTGWFECSDGHVNQLFHNIVWGQKGNYLEIPTDCPQRDERLGWTGDAQFFIRTGAYNMDVAAFFAKWLTDLVEDAQYADGSFASVAPDMGLPGRAVGWDDAGIICPYVIYKVYGDERVIRDHWAGMCRYIAFLEKSSTDLVRGVGPYGDWLNQGGGAKAEVMGTAYFAYVAGLMAEMGRVIGKREDARRFGALAERVKAKFRREFVKEDGSILESSQTGFALAFTMGLLPEAVRAKAAEKFEEEIRKKDWHLGTGFIGTPRLLPALSEAGKEDVAYKLLLQDTFPSWLYQVKLGATTMWERWDGFIPPAKFQDPGMNSFNHYAFGSIGEWMWGTMVGIEAEEPGFRTIRIRPRPGGGIGFVKGRYASINGEIVSEWKEKAGKFEMRVVVPVNCVARVHVPSSDVGAVKVDGGKATEVEGVRYVGQEGGAAVFEVGSGEYRFVARR